MAALHLGRATTPSDKLLTLTWDQGSEMTSGLYLPDWLLERCHRDGHAMVWGVATLTYWGSRPRRMQRLVVALGVTRLLKRRSLLRSRVTRT